METDENWQDPYYTLKGHDDLTVIEQALLSLHDANLNFIGAVQSAIHVFVKRAQAERTAQRRAIVHRHQAIHGPRARVATSHMILMASIRVSSVELFWAEAWYTQGRAKPKYNRIRTNTKEGADLRKVLKGAHPDEVELLARHEWEASELRHRWREATDLQRSLSARLRAAVKAREKRKRGELPEE